MTKSALLSADRKFRYTLLRRWDETKPCVAFIGLNPSTADESEDDPTIRRCIGFAKAWGFGSLLMLNLYGYRATMPKDLKRQKLNGDVVGEANRFEHLRSYIETYECTLVVAAWGKDGKNRGDEARCYIPGMKCLGRNGDGTPKHPLYLKSDSVLEGYS